MGMDKGEKKMITDLSVFGFRGKRSINAGRIRVKILHALKLPPTARRVEVMAKIGKPCPKGNCPSWRHIAQRYLPEIYTQEQLTATKPKIGESLDFSDV